MCTWLKSFTYKLFIHTLSQIKISTNFVDQITHVLCILFLWFVCIGIKQCYKYGRTTKHEHDQVKHSGYKNCNLNGSIYQNNKIYILIHFPFVPSAALNLHILSCVCVCVSQFGGWRKISSSIRVSLMKYTQTWSPPLDQRDLTRGATFDNERV